MSQSFEENMNRNFSPLIVLALALGTGPAVPSLADDNTPPAAAGDAAELGIGVAQASPSPDGARVAFQKKTAAGWRIYTSRLDGSDAKPLTAGPGDDVEPNWRPDGAAIAFSSSRNGHWDLFTVNPDGTGLKAITNGPQDARYPQWSPRAFELPWDKDPLKKSVTDRKNSGVTPSDLQLLQMLATNSTSWDIYKDRFNSHTAAHYYKLLYVQGKGDTRQIATIREDGRQPMTLSTGLTGTHLNPSWDRTAKWIAFDVRNGSKNTIYTADYPVTRDLNDGEGQIKFGIDQKALRDSLKPIGSVDGVAAQVSWTPNGEYVAVAAGGSMQLLPRPDLKLKPISVTTDPIAAYGFGWLSDASTALVTTGSGTTTQFRRVAFSAPLLDIVNIHDFDDLTPPDRDYLTRNAFVAGGTPEKQMFDVYEETDYSDLPIFVTTDSLLHLNHLVFDYLLRGVESDHLTPSTIALVDHYLRASLQQAKTSTDSGVRASAMSNAAFFAVAARLALGEVHTGEAAAQKPKTDDPLAADQAAYRAKLDKQGKVRLQEWTAPLRATLATLPLAVKTQVAAELSLIKAHGGLAASPIFGGRLKTTAGESIGDTRIDYTDFIPRGHYTRSEVLRRYFLMSRWLSAGPFRHSPALTQRALLIAAATDTPTLNTWQKVEDTIHQFVGSADDQDLAAYLKIAKDVYGGRITLPAVADKAKTAAFLDAVAKLPEPRIAPAAGPSFRFLPLPYTPDSDIMQQMIYDRNPPDVGTEEKPRYFALGLDVMAVLGSDRAHELLSNMKFQGSFFDFDLKETEYENYDTQYQAQRTRFANWPDWDRSLYTRTLYASLPLIDGQDIASAPASDTFAHSPAWIDKSLNTALGTWAELKHDTLPKQPMAIEAGGEGGISESIVPVQPVGFVEPSPEVFRRIGLLIAAERRTLTAAGYLTPDITARLDTMSSLITMVQNIAKKQVAGTALTPREVEQLRFFGAYQEHLTLVTAEGGEKGSAEGNDMAIIADVASAYSTTLKTQLALEEGVGRALPIYVSVPVNGHRQLARGAIFTYYEFTHPANDRLTDEKWRDLLGSSKPPAVPEWTSSFNSGIVPEGN